MYKVIENRPVISLSMCAYTKSFRIRKLPLVAQCCSFSSPFWLLSSPQTSEVQNFPLTPFYSSAVAELQHRARNVCYLEGLGPCQLKTSTN